ncbi:MAG: HlyD family efflux transporter periplasmic adaptor subunit [Clostridia bacterium]|nr:HlyD family efflux transporter periplasmic adaptor subunit [Clostridia bacterium]
MTQTKQKRKGRKRFKRLLIWLILLALAGGAFYLFVLPGLNESATTTYNAYEATIGTISNSLSFSGNVSVMNSETLASQSDAIVRQIYVGEEEEVVSGQKLMRLSNGETLKASFDGRINEIGVEVGDSVTASTGLIQIVDFNNLKVTMRVDEYGINDLQVGQACRVTVTALDLTFDSVISHINRISSSNGNTAYYTVTAELAVTENVLPGMQVTVTIPQEEAVDAVILNKTALSFDQRNSAYVLVKNDAGEMENKFVEIGVDNDNYVEITSGLTAGEKVYAKVETKTAGATGLAAMFSSMGGGGTMPSGGMPSMNQSNSGGGNRPSGNFGGGNRGGW